MQRMCITPAAGSHLAVTAMVISSVETDPSPSISGNDRKAVKRAIFLNTLSSLALSSRASRSTGCAVPASIPVRVSVPMTVHLLPCVK